MVCIPTEACSAETVEINPRETTKKMMRKRSVVARHLHLEHRRAHDQPLEHPPLAGRRHERDQAPHGVGEARELGCSRAA